jgi:voltage-gated potassium channel
MSIERRTQLFTRVEQLTEVPMLVLSVIFLVIVLLIEIGQLDAATLATLDAILWLIWGVFALELAVKLYLAPARGRFLLTHVVDVLIVLVPFLRPLRILRAIIGAARVWRLLRTVLRRQTLSFIGLSSMAMVLICALLVYAAERNAGGPIDTFPNAIWWAIATITTVGYGDMYPVTAFGRGVAVFLMLTGITLFGLLTAQVAAFFIHEDQEGEEKVERREYADIVQRLERMERMLAEQQRAGKIEG